MKGWIKRLTGKKQQELHSPIFSRHLATFTSPAKGVGWGDWRANPSFSAIYVHNRNVVHVVFLEENS